MATTPPVTSVIDTPATPRFAGVNSRHYNTRKSARRPPSQPAHSTPPPQSSRSKAKGHSSKAKRRSTPPASAALLHSPPSSIYSSPEHKQRRSKKASHLKMDNSNVVHQNGNAGHDSSVAENGKMQRSGSAQSHHMLPTPASLPRKKNVSQAAVNAAARVLFPTRPESVEEAMPVPRRYRKQKKHVGFSLYASDAEEESHDDIKIYTDSQDKVPELDPREDNPFLEHPTKRTNPDSAMTPRSKKRKQSQEVQTNPRIKEAFDREEGMVYVFRGKKIYRKFPNDSDSEDEDEDSITQQPTDQNRKSHMTGEPTGRPLTRSSIKPRLLFPPSEETADPAGLTDDEEAPTEIEDHLMQEDDAEKEVKVTTPVKSSFAPSTPPSTGHATRSSTKTKLADTAEASGPAPRKRHMKYSFDAWAREKPGVSGNSAGLDDLGGAVVQGKKRDAKFLSKFDGQDESSNAKRVKSDSFA